MKPYYDDGQVTIYHGHCLEIIPSIEHIDAVITDPPFKLSEVYSKNPDADNLDAVASIQHTARYLRDRMDAGSTSVVFYDNRIMPFAIDAFRRAGWQYLRMLAFYRRWGNAYQMNGWMSTTDPVLVFAVPGAKPTFYGTCAHDTFIRSSPAAEDTGHPAQKPVEFVAQIAQRICPGDGLILDPYMGSGTALVAAKLVGRRAIGIDTDERSCETAARRLEQAVLPLGGIA